jgi:GT2 family glycosyltransferase
MLLVGGSREPTTDSDDHGFVTESLHNSNLPDRSRVRQFGPFLTSTPTYEIIVADDGLTSTAEAMIRQRFPWVRWVQGPGIGPAANRNAGAEVARGAWLAFTDDDCLPQPDWLQAFLIAIASHPGLTVFEGKTVPDRPRKTLAEHSPVGSRAGNLWSCNFAILRSKFEHLGGFDPQFKVCMEDNDFALRVRKSGLIFPFVEDALVVHPWRSRRLSRDGWKSNNAAIFDHLRFQAKFPDSPSTNPARLIRLGLRVLWCDLCFVFGRRDLKGVPYAISDLFHILHLALTLAK